MNAVRRGNEIGGKILGIAIAHHCIGTRIKCLIDLGKKIGMQKVVRIEKQISLEAFDAVIAFDAVKQVLQRIALACSCGILSFVHNGTSRAADVGGIVVAIIGDHKHADAAHIIILYGNTVQ